MSPSQSIIIVLLLCFFYSISELVDALPCVTAAPSVCPRCHVQCVRSKRVTDMQAGSQTYRQTDLAALSISYLATDEEIRSIITCISFRKVHKHQIRIFLLSLV